MARTYAVTYFYSPDVALQDATRPAHLAHLRHLVDAGTLVASGPWGADDARGGLLILRVDDQAAVQAIVDVDPFITQGVVASSEIREWVPLLGPAAQTLVAGENRGQSALFSGDPRS
jgi:uncharacterized protein YciI